MVANLLSHVVVVFFSLFYNLIHAYIFLNSGACIVFIQLGGGGASVYKLIFLMTKIVASNSDDIQSI
jgi:hypothetical protein